MVGGLATRFHGYDRATDDLDLWLDDTQQNRKNLRKAFTELNYGDLNSDLSFAIFSEKNFLKLSSAPLNK